MARDRVDQVVEEAIRAIESEFSVAMGSAARVEACCERLTEHLQVGVSQLSSDNLEAFERLVPVVGRRSGAIAEVLFDFLRQVASSCDRPWRLLRGLLDARSQELVDALAEDLVALASQGRLEVDGDVLQVIARLAEGRKSGAGKEAILRHACRLIRGDKPVSGDKPDAVEELYRAGVSHQSRRLAALILDSEEQTVPERLSRELLGENAYDLLGKYLAYSRATHLDLLNICPAIGQEPPMLASLRIAESSCGEELIREVVGRLGWDKVNHGFQVTRYVGLSVNDSFPLLIKPEEVSLFGGEVTTEEVFDRFLIAAHGGRVDETGESGEDDGSVARFRTYNLTHAKALADIVDVAPLTVDKIRRILNRMDRIVADFSLLFSDHEPECEKLGRVYADLRKKVVAGLDEGAGDHSLSSELTRLVQMFEDPTCLDEVQTIHGLKRYLHQKGLRLGFKLFESGRSTNRSVDLVVASGNRIIRSADCIRYIDFEPSDRRPGGQGRFLSYPLQVVVDGFGRQLLHGRKTVPKVEVFCYGNEVHYYLRYINHPAFLRVDFAPPLSGGMADLEYFGVSKHELSLHPDLDLLGIQRLFQVLEFDVQIKDTRIHARYDKERALDFGDLCAKVEGLFNLVPYLMEVDWVIGYLDLNADAKMVVAEAWAEFFSRWQVLPVWRMLTEDRQRIRLNKYVEADGVSVKTWNGRGEYRDLFSADVPPTILNIIHNSLASRGLVFIPVPEEKSVKDFGQCLVDRVLLKPLRQAVSRGEVMVTGSGLRPAPPQLFQLIDEAVYFADLLSSEKDVLVQSYRLGGLVSSLEKSLRFQTKGLLNGYEVQRANLGLRGGMIKVYVLRDAGGIIRLAVYAGGGRLFRSRKRADEDWTESGSCDVARMVSMLRRNSYLTPGTGAVQALNAEEVVSACSVFRTMNPSKSTKPIAGDRILQGAAASPGRAVGRVLFGTENRTPSDFTGAILMSERIRPEDVTFLCRAEGVVSTSGGVLSHAGLLAVQFSKPAMIVPGRWVRSADGLVSVAYRYTEYDEVERRIGDYLVTSRRDVREFEDYIQEGDLVSFDTDPCTMRILGRDREVISLHEGLRQLAYASNRLMRVTNEAELLVLRGRQLHARHQVEKLLSRMKRTVLARHAVRELLLSGSFGGSERDVECKASLLKLLLKNEYVARDVQEWVVEITRNILNRRTGRSVEALRMIPTAAEPYEVLALRLGVTYLSEVLKDLRRALPPESPLSDELSKYESSELDSAVRSRLLKMRTDLVCELPVDPSQPEISAQLRHSLRQVSRLDRLLGPTESHRQVLGELQMRLATEDANNLQRCRESRILTPADGGFEIHPLIGWKAANLAEVSRLGAAHLVPHWFVVTDYAFREILESPVDRRVDDVETGGGGIPTLREAIQKVLSDESTSDAVKSNRVGMLWESVRLSSDFREEVLEAYRGLGKTFLDSGGDQRDSRDEPFVAVRSSSLEEDTEVAARAGEFETFLFVRGPQTLVRHLKRAWSGLWTERAIHNRRLLGIGPIDAGGGVLVQRIVWSRVSGVLQTVNLAEGRLREIVINVGLGLGEGIVSGIVAADQVLISKEAAVKGGPLRFRYVTADKREQVVFDARSGVGTITAETLYHQRMRPALEYVELCELVKVASDLENAYGYPLDVEFGIEGTSLRILQVRPVANFGSVLNTTLERYPLPGGRL